ncbi:MAG: phenylalanine--tRNA ligase subunit beta [bacterium]
MPVVSIPVSLLSRLVKSPLTSEELIKVLTDLGCDVEGWDAKTLTLKINLLPARPDMFDVCGLARSIKGYLGIETGIPKYNFTDSGMHLKVKDGLKDVRPYICAAVVRNLCLDDELLKILMDLQENLHWGLGRDRRRASIGIYDLSKVEPDFFYQPVAPTDISFVPLGGDRPLTPKEILIWHPKGQVYQHLLKDFRVYPLLTDRNGDVLSLPPIINSENTKITTATRDLLIDVTGPDEWTIKKMLAVLVASCSELGAQVQTVKIEFPDGKSWTTPDMQPEEMDIDPDETAAVIGTAITGEEMAQLLRRMRYDAIVSPLNSTVRVFAPAYRTDIMHPWDVIEDVAIAYGYHRLQPKPLPTATTSQPLPIEEISQLCRKTMTGLGFIEIMSLNLTSPEAQFDRLGIARDQQTVYLKNPVSVEQRILRRQLLAAILETFSLNSTQPLPQNIFEIGDVFLLDPDAETGAVQERRLAIGMADSKIGFAEIKSVICALAREMDWQLRFIPSEQMPFLTGRCASIQTRAGSFCGICGEVHPQILERYRLSVPVVLAEINLITLFPLNPSP